MAAEQHARPAVVAKQPRWNAHVSCSAAALMSGEADRHAVRHLSALRVRSCTLEVTDKEAVLVEEPLEIRVSGEPVATTLRTPGADRELALGYLFSEGAIESRADVASIAHCGHLGAPGYGNVIDVTPAPGVCLARDPLERLRPRALVSSACGACGRADIVEQCLARGSSLREDALTITAEQALRCVHQLTRNQRFFASTGGSHAAAVMTSAGRVCAAAEDVGRHNAVDKVIGSLLLREQLSVPQRLLVVSSRAGFEIVQKACMARVAVVIGLSAPTTLAVQMARRCSMTLIGFVRAQGFNVYSGEHRLRATDAGRERRGPTVA